MTAYQNPFFLKASEHQRNPHQFISSFSPGAIDILPEPIWDRVVIFRSTPGAGKTSLMRLFRVESLEWVRQKQTSSDLVYQRLRSLEVFDASGPRKLGLHIDLDRDYTSLLDLPAQEDVANRLFLRLLDVRIVMAAMKGALTIRGHTFPEDVHLFRFDTSRLDPEIGAACSRLGGEDGLQLLQYARETEHLLLRVLDALLPGEVEREFKGHNELYSVKVLSEAPILVEGISLDVQPLLMFDDGHKLDLAQRDLLLDQLRVRRTNIARWYAERFEALSDQELLGAVGQLDRDYLLVDLDSIARNGTEDGRRFQKGRYDKVLADIAIRRASPALMTYAQEDQDFFSLLEDSSDEHMASKLASATDSLRERITSLARDDQRYSEWISGALRLQGHEAAIRWRELEILIRRDRDRQLDLFSQVLNETDLSERSNSGLREGAALLLAREFDLPFYGGRRTILRLGDHNAEQFLNLCGEVFSEMLVDVSLGRTPRINLARQHRVIRAASEKRWQEIPTGVPNGRDIQAFISELVAGAAIENSRPTLPYPPGVTGTALLMSDRARLLDPEFRKSTPGAERLFRTLASAVAHNVLRVEMNYSVKNRNYMVIYLNRLLCPRFFLPLGSGSFREKPLNTMISWVMGPPKAMSFRKIKEQEAGRS